MIKKLFTITSLLLLFSCKTSSDLFIERQVIDQDKIEKNGQTTDVFASRELNTIYANKKKIKVALFLPTTGKYAELADSIYKASIMSLFDNDTNHNLELVLIDSKDTPIEASKALREVKNRNIKIMIGPIFSTFVNAVDKNVLRHSIAAISLSNNQDLKDKITENKGAIFIGGFLPEQQIDRMVTYALSQNKTNFAILAPNNEYGLTLAQIFKKIVRMRDGLIVSSEAYDPNSLRSIKKATERVVNSFSVPSHLAEGGGNKFEEGFAVPESDRSYPEVIFIPETGKTLHRVASLIKDLNKNEREFQLIGTGQWEDVDILNDKNLEGAWFAAPDHARFAAFERVYYQTYHKFPPRIASIAYDSVAAISELVDRTGGKTPVIGDFVDFSGGNEKNGFEGIDGTFRFLKNGLVQRNLAVIRVSNGNFETIAPASDVFLKYDYAEQFGD